MTIQLLVPPEPNPITPHDTETLVIESAGLQQLDRELERYCRREVEGRSFLISGHRGAGKTTMVNYALWQAVRQSRTDPTRARPLVIRLHGPNLIRATESDKAEEEASKGSTDQDEKQAAGDNSVAQVEYLMKRLRTLDRETDDDLRRVQIALQQITLGLHRALCAEIIASYRKRVQDSGAPLALQQELFERAAQLEMELDQYPTPDRLRQYWAAGRFLHDGVLFPASPERRLEVPDQGLRELVAVASVSHAFLRVSGKFEKAELKQTLNASQSSSFTIGGKDGYDFLAPLLSLLGGTAVGTAAATIGNQPALASTFSGILAAFGAAGVFKYSAVRTRARGFSSDLTFMPDLRVTTLDRVLPMLIDRIRSAGLVPVFVVDELDKIDNLSTQLGRIVRHMKTIVAERAFFCFLTDRSYYERVVKINVLDPYPKDYTYFSDRVFVSFKSDDLMNYLKTIMRVENGATAAEPVAAEQDEDKLDLEVLPYVLLRRSQLHALDLRRELGKWRDSNNPTVIDSRRVRSHFAFRFDLLVQFAVELIINRKAVANKLRDDPTLSRLLYDALYYPVRNLTRKPGENGTAFDPYDIDLSDAAEARQHFHDYLIERMSSDKETPPKSHQEDYVPLGLEGVDVDFLYEQVRAFVPLLADPFALMDELNSPENQVSRPAATLLQTLPLNPPDGPLIRRVWNEQHKYRWRYRADWTVRDETDKRYSNTRGPLAHQLDLWFRLASRMVLRGPQARTFIRNSEARRYQLETLLQFVHEAWLRGTSSIDFKGEAFLSVVDACVPDAAERKAARDLVKELIELLSDHERYFSRLSELELRERYDIIRKTFQRHAPPARARGVVSCSFQYDRDGNALVRGIEHQFWADIDKDWEKNLTFVQQLSEFLSRWARSARQKGGGGLDLSTLAATVRVLPPTPSWPTVSAAVLRLEGYRSRREYYPQLDEDSALLATYVREVLLPNRHALANALIAGAVIGRASDLDFGSACLKGLDVLQGAYRFGDADGHPVDETLDRVVLSVCAQFSGLTDMLTELRNAGKGDLPEWLDALQRIGSSIQSMTMAADDQKRIVTRAWERWSEYVDQQQPAGYPVRFEPAAENLFCRAGNFGPDALLLDTPGAMTLAQWSTAYMRGVLGNALPLEIQAPPWLAGTARQALGLDATTEHKRSLIVRSNNAADSPWPVPIGYGVLSLTSAYLALLLEHRTGQPELFPGVPRFDHIFVEHDADMQLLPALLERLSREGAVTNAVIFGGVPSQPASWAARVVDQARTPEDLLRLMEARRIESSADLPAAFAAAWNSGAVFTGQLAEQLEGSTAGASVTFEGNVTPGGTLVRISGRGIGGDMTLHFEKGRLIQRGGLSQHRHRVAYDGVSLTLERAHAMHPLSPIRLLLALFAATERIELRQRGTSNTFELRLRRQYSPLRQFVGAPPERRYYGLVTLNPVAR